MDRATPTCARRKAAAVVDAAPRARAAVATLDARACRDGTRTRATFDRTRRRTGDEGRHRDDAHEHARL